MSKQAVSVTLDAINVTWLRGRVTAGGGRSVSELLDSLVTEARVAGRGADETLRSVVGTIDIDVSDPELLTADEAIRSQFDASLRRPMLVKESAPARRPRRG
jgi:hypothetical protein